MGNDGGSFSHRAEMIKSKKLKKRIDPLVKAANKATLCAISGERLKKPLVICKLGNIYSKEQVMERMLNKTVQEPYRHLQKLKDLKEVSAGSIKEDAEGFASLQCAVTGKEFNGLVGFSFMWDCGCLLAEEALKELGFKEKCVGCEAAASEGSVVKVVQSEEEQEAFLKKFDQTKKVKKRRHPEMEEIKEEIKEEEAPLSKKQKTTTIQGKSQTFKNLFHQGQTEAKGSDFLCRNIT